MMREEIEKTKGVHTEMVRINQISANKERVQRKQGEKRGKSKG